MNRDVTRSQGSAWYPPDQRGGPAWYQRGQGLPAARQLSERPKINAGSIDDGLSTGPVLRSPANPTSTLSAHGLSVPTKRASRLAKRQFCPFPRDPGTAPAGARRSRQRLALQPYRAANNESANQPTRGRIHGLPRPPAIAARPNPPWPSPFNSPIGRAPSPRSLRPFWAMFLPYPREWCLHWPSRRPRRRCSTTRSG